MLQISVLFLAFLAPAATQISSNMDGRQISITRQTGSSVVITCDIVNQNTNYIVHWYRYQEGMAPRRLLYYEFSRSQFVVDQGISSEKYHVYEGTGRSCKFVLRNLEERDSGVYYCAVWERPDRKIFGDGTKLVITDRNFGPEFSPKPTIFLPSTAEINHQEAGTYLCLLENFFPDVIKVHWKEKNSDTILESQQGTTMKTNDTYMKFSWLTLTANSMNKEHKCIVRHENNVNGVDQEILFPSMKKEVAANHATEKPSLKDQHEVAANHATEKPLKDQSEVNANNATEKACLKDQSGTLQLQLINTSAYYTYLLLLLKSVIYFAIVAFCLFKRLAVCGDGKSQ